MLVTTQQWFGITLTTSPTFGFFGAALQVHQAVLLGEPGDLRIGILDDAAKALGVVLLVGHDLRARVEYRPILRRAADHRGAHGHGAVVPSGRAGGDLHDVVVDVGSRPVFGKHRKIAGALEGWRSTARHHRNLDPCSLQQLQCALQPLPLLGLCGWERHQAFELHVRHAHRRTRQVEGGLRALHAVAAEAGIAFDEEAHVDAMAAACFRQSLGDHLVIQHHGHALQALDQRRQPLGLGFADHIEGEQDVIGHAGVGHHFDLAELLAGDADSARIDLHLGERRQLVRLDMRAIGETES